MSKSFSLRELVKSILTRVGRITLKIDFRRKNNNYVPPVIIPIPIPVNHGPSIIVSTDTIKEEVEKEIKEERTKSEGDPF